MRRDAALNRCVGEAPRFVIEIHDDLANDHAVRERHDAGVSVQARIREHARNQGLVHVAHVADRLPHGLRTGVDPELLVNGSHVVFLRKS